MTLFNLPGKVDASVHHLSNILTGGLLVMLVLWACFQQMGIVERQVAGAGVGGLFIGFAAGFMFAKLGD